MSRPRIASAQPCRSQSIASASLSLPVASGNAFTLEHRSEGVAGSSTDATAIATVQEAPIAPRTKLASAPAIPGTSLVQEPTAESGIPQNRGASQPSGNSSLALPAPAPQVLPSLLRYVDHDLMLTAAVHNHPEHANVTCAICILPWDSLVPIAARINGVPQATQFTPAVRSTFLPLSPCGHWVHYRCLISTTTQTSSDGKDKCFVCRTPLFQWEGITVLTLATRTGFGFQLEEQIRDPADRLVSTSTGPSYTAYRAECDTIDALIPQHFFAQLTYPSRFTDRSPDLVNVYYDVIQSLAAMRRLQSRWLSYGTDIGYLLFCMFVCIKMKRWLEEKQSEITATEGWRVFEEGREAIRGKILAEVNKA